MDRSARVLSVILCVTLVREILSADVGYSEMKKRRFVFINNTIIEEKINFALENKFKEFEAQKKVLFKKLEINLLEKLSETHSEQLSEN